MEMKEYKFSNLNIKAGGQDYLVAGVAYYSIEEFDDGNEAGFESVKLYDAIGKEGYITSEECLKYIAEATVQNLNQNSTLCRRLGWS